MLSEAKRFVAQKFRKRKLRAYCVGTPKSGTHLIATMTQHYLWSSHEPQSRQLIHLVLSHNASVSNQVAVDTALKERDRRLKLEVESSSINVYFIDRLVRLFPTLRFILTIRHPRTYLDSIINHSLSDNTPDHWQKFREFRFGKNTIGYQPEEAILKEKGLYSLDAYLSYWKWHNQRVLEHVPADRLLVIKTSEISHKKDDIFKFLNIEGYNAEPATSHSFKAREKYNILDAIDSQFLQQKIQWHCSEVLTKYFNA